MYVCVCAQSYWPLFGRWCSLECLRLDCPTRGNEEKASFAKVFDLEKHPVHGRRTSIPSSMQLPLGVPCTKYTHKRLARRMAGCSPLPTEKLSQKVYSPSCCTFAFRFFRRARQYLNIAKTRECARNPNFCWVENDGKKGLTTQPPEAAKGRFPRIKKCSATRRKRAQTQRNKGSSPGRPCHP